MPLRLLHFGFTEQRSKRPFYKARFIFEQKFQFWHQQEKEKMGGENESFSFLFSLLDLHNGNCAVLSRAIFFHDRLESSFFSFWRRQQVKRSNTFLPSHSILMSPPRRYFPLILCDPNPPRGEGSNKFVQQQSNPLSPAVSQYHNLWPIKCDVSPPLLVIFSRFHFSSFSNP